MVAAMDRSHRWPVTYRRPTAISWRIDGFGPWAASSCGSTAASGRRIQNRNAAETA